MKILKTNQVVIFVIALMLITAGYLNFSNQQKAENSLLPTSALADTEEYADIGDATLVNANETKETNTNENQTAENNVEEKNNTQSNIQEVKNSSDDGYFKASKIDRDKMYAQNLENYQKIIETTGVSTEERTEAQNEIKRINDEKNAIMIAENLIKTKGFQDVIIFVNNGNITVIVKTEKLEEQQIAQIQNIITRELGVSVDKINISCKK